MGAKKRKKEENKNIKRYVATSTDVVSHFDNARPSKWKEKERISFNLFFLMVHGMVYQSLPLSLFNFSLPSLCTLAYQLLLSSTFYSPKSCRYYVACLAREPHITSWLYFS